jgi:formylmethanofuran dehydrogenase subunit E
MMREPLATIDPEPLDRVVAFHGHLCPGLTMGMQAAHIALREMGPHAEDEEMVAAVETDMCGVDAVQVLTGCTFGKGNLIHRDWGKNAYSFWRRSDGRGIRVAGRPAAWGERDPQQEELRAKVRSGEANAEEERRFREAHHARARELLDREPDELFTVTELDEPPPRRARIHSSVVCEECGEPTMETRVRRLGGRELCQPCFDAALGGRG